MTYTEAEIEEMWAEARRAARADLQARVRRQMRARARDRAARRREFWRRVTNLLR